MTLTTIEIPVYFGCVMYSLFVLYYLMAELLQNKRNVTDAVSFVSVGLAVAVGVGRHTPGVAGTRAANPQDSALRHLRRHVHRHLPHFHAVLTSLLPLHRRLRVDLLHAVWQPGTTFCSSCCFSSHLTL